MKVICPLKLNFRYKIGDKKQGGDDRTVFRQTSNKNTFKDTLLFLLSI